MDDFGFQIVANPDPANTAAASVEKSLGRVEAAAGRASTAGVAAGQQIGAGMDVAEEHAKRAGAAVQDVHGGLMDLVALGAAYISGHELKELADGYTEISNKIRVVSQDEANFNGLMETTHGIAQDTRTEWDGVVSVYQRLSQVTSGLGLSQRNVLDLTKEMSEAAKISGASTREASMAMGEITHAFETGALTGREYKVLMRDTPAMMKELQIASGKTGAEFVAMGKHGQITAQLLVDLFGKAAPAIEAKFEQTIPTISDMFVKLRNEAERFFGSTATGAGILRGLNSVIQFVVDHFEQFAKVAIGVGEALLGLYAISKVIQLVKLLSAAISANPLGALVTAAIIAISVLRQFGDQLNVDSGHVAKLSDFFAVLWEYIKRLATAIGDLVTGAWKMLSDAFSAGLDSTGIELSLKNVILFVANFVDTLIAMFRVLRDRGKEMFGALAIIIASAFVDAFNAGIGAMESFLNKASRALYDTMNGTAKKISEASKQAKADMDDWAKTHDSLGIAQSQLGPRPERAAVYNPRGALSDVQKKEIEDTERSIDAYDAALLKRSSDIFSRQQQVFDEAAKRANDLDKDGHALGANGKEYKPYEFDKINNPLADLSKQGKDFLGESRKKMIDDAANGDAKRYVERFFDDVNKHARDRAKQGSVGSSISDTKGTAEGRLPTDAEIAAAKKLENELRGVVEQSNPVVDAQEKIVHALKIVDQAMGSGSKSIQDMLNRYGGGVAIMDKFKAKLEDQIHPHEAYIRKIMEQTNALRLDANEQADAAAMTKYLDDMRQKGIAVTEAQKRQAEDQIRNLRESTQLIDRERTAYEQINGPAKTYWNTVIALDQLLAHGKITQDQFNKSIEQARDQFAQATPYGKSFAYGLTSGLHAVRDEIVDIAAQVRTTLVNAFHSVEDAIVDLMTKGKADWSQMINSMLRDLTRLLIRQALLSAFPGLGPGIQGMGPFAMGGSFVVGGSGGTDKTMVAFRATPGERVTVTGGGKSNSGGGGGGPAPVTIVNTNDERASALAMLRTKAGEQAILNVISKNRNIVRGR